jgi:hypothetical protein
MGPKKRTTKPDGENAKQVAPSRQTQQKIERIPAEYTDPLYDYIQKVLQDPSLDEGMREQKTNDYNNYLASHRQLNVRQYRRTGKERTDQKLVLYGPGEFNELLRIAGLSFRDYFEQIRKPSLQEAAQSTMEFLVLSEDEVWLRDTCDRMDKKTLDRVREIAVEMSPKFWSSEETQLLPPTMRLITLLSMQIQRVERAKLPPPVNTETILKAVNDRHRCTTVTMEDLLVMANALHVSIHWLMMGDDSIAATAKNPRTEMVLTAYGFMMESTQRTFLKVVRYIDTMQSMWEGGEMDE